MSKKLKYDFSGYATKNDIKCTDGRTIRKDAFKENDGQTVPLVWHHLHNEPDNVLGHAILENREDGVYVYGVFNNTENGKKGKELVAHGDITCLSIYANNLVEKSKNVIHGAIREVSLVMVGANPAARIENVTIYHADGSEDLDESEGVIFHQVPLDKEEDVKHVDAGKGEDKTVKDVFDSMNEDQQNVVYVMITKALEDAGLSHSDDDDENDEGGKQVKKNVFDDPMKKETEGKTLTHAQFKVILDDAVKCGSLKEAILAHAVDYGIENIDVLFPDAQTLSRDPEWLKREDSWVQGVLAAIHKSPFSRVKSVFADMDIDTARAKGYVKATEKKETYFKAAKRVTTPYTIYVKQKLDRDDIIDVVDFDIVAMVRFQLRTLLDEELAQAALIGDGRQPEDPYKIPEENIRPIWTDDDLYSVKELITATTEYDEMVEEISKTHKRYKGSGSPVFYTTSDLHTNMLWIKDANGRRIYESDATLCAALRVSRIEEVPHFENKFRTLDNGAVHQLLGIKVNLSDYNFGADKGGQVATFEDFDIDFNQHKYLMETRCSGALTRAHSAQVYEIAVPRLP